MPSASDLLRLLMLSAISSMGTRHFPVYPGDILFAGRVTEEIKYARLKGFNSFPIKKEDNTRVKSLMFLINIQPFVFPLFIAIKRNTAKQEIQNPLYPAHPLWSFVLLFALANFLHSESLVAWMLWGKDKILVFNIGLKIGFISIALARKCMTLEQKPKRSKLCQHAKDRSNK